MVTATLAAWSQIAASLAVLLTLIYLAIQIRQSSALMRAESRQALISYTQQEIFKLVEYPELLLSLAEPKELAPAESVRLTAWLNAVFRAREHEWIQYRNGVLDEDTWNSYKQVIPLIHLGTKRGREWWSKFGQGQFHPKFCQLVDDLLREHPQSDYISTVIAMK